MEYGFWTPYKAPPLSKWERVRREVSRQIQLEMLDEIDKHLREFLDRPPISPDHWDHYNG